MYPPPQPRRSVVGTTLTVILTVIGVCCVLPAVVCGIMAALGVGVGVPWLEGVLSGGG
jgi:hypothetical protein